MCPCCLSGRSFQKWLQTSAVPLIFDGLVQFSLQKTPGLPYFCEPGLRGQVRGIPYLLTAVKLCVQQMIFRDLKWNRVLPRCLFCSYLEEKQQRDLLLNAIEILIAREVIFTALGRASAEMCSDHLSMTLHTKRLLAQADASQGGDQSSFQSMMLSEKIMASWTCVQTLDALSFLIDAP